MKFKKLSPEALKQKLTKLQYDVTHHNKTEPAFANEYYNEFKKGIYVDITSGEPLFVSTDKFESGCGWPAFSKPINQDNIALEQDNSFGMTRIEVRTRNTDIHLGHVFGDGPKELGGLRYCINSAALKFIPYEKMAELGYKEYMKLIKD